MELLPVQTMIIFSVLITVIMIFVSVLVYLGEREKRHLNILEFWVAYGGYFLVSYLTEGRSPYLVALSTLMWIWRTRTIRLILEGITRESLFQKWHLKLIASSYVLCILFAVIGLPFDLFTLPASIGVFCVGMDYLYTTWLMVREKKMSSLHYMMLMNIAIIFFHILDYPFIRFDHSYTALGFGIVLLTTILMAIFIPSVTVYELERDYQIKLEDLVHDRSAQLVTQSKMSALGEMSSGMAHEINNPLSIIAGRASQLRRINSKGNGEREVLIKGLEQIENTSERITKIIKGLQEFSRDTKGEETQSVALEQLINETLFLCHERFQAQGVQLIVSHIPHINIECRHIQITQVFVNLLNNAFDAIVSHTERWVRIDFNVNENDVEIRVIDSGHGIAEDIRSKMMQPFFTTKEVGKGTGLGLAISRGIVEDHRGNFFYDPQSPHTCFVVKIPKLSH